MLSLLENVMLPMDFCETYPLAEREARGMELLDMVGLADCAHAMPDAVSGGQQQSAAIARALANDPPIIVADEPTGNLDSRAAENVYEIFRDLAARRKTIVMVTHDDGLARRASRTLLLADGELVDETVAAALPLLTHRQMLEATRRLEPRSFAPGEAIIREGEPNDRFFMIRRGHVDVTLRGANGAEETISRMGPGEFFGEISTMLSSLAVASVRAALHAPVEAVALGRVAFLHLMAEAQAMRNAIARVMRERLVENSARGGGAWLPGHPLHA
jgi:putative ABC transport system ATP-binding protein